jgi:NADH-quinone oxidoreductase chain G
MDATITLTIDGKLVTAPAGATILAAARGAGIEIPTFCDYAKLAAIGACRMCLVEIEKVRAPQPACTTPVRQDMIVRTNTPALVKARKTTLEFLLTNHPLDCPVCDKAGECELQDQVYKYGPGESRFIEDKRHKGKAKILSEHIIIDQERCVLCRRCIRFLEEWADDLQLGLFERGRKTCVDTFPGDAFDSAFSGNTTDLCPVGALTSRHFRFSARSWELKRTDSICQGCAVGCTISLHTKANALKRILARETPALNDEWLCDRGRFDHSFADPAGRITTPLVREKGKLVPTTWDAALRLATDRLREIGARAGGGAIACIGSARASNEANYLLGRLGRETLTTQHIAMLGQPPEKVRLLKTTRVLDSAGVVLVVGLDLAEEAPLLELLARHGGLSGCTRFIVLNPQTTRLARFGVWLGAKAGAETVVAGGLARLALEKRLADGVPGMEELYQSVAGYKADVVEALAGVSAEKLNAVAALLASAKTRTIIYGGAAAQNIQLRRALEVLALTAGCDEPAYIPGAVNTVGARDMGIVPDDGGLDVDGLGAAVQSGAVQAAYVLGKAPASLAGIGFLVVQASREGDLPAGGADVVLPACTFAEAEGTYTNLCGGVGRAKAALRPLGESRPDWWIVAQMGDRLGRSGAWAFESAGAVTAAIAAEMPAYREG